MMKFVFLMRLRVNDFDKIDDGIDDGVYDDDSGVDGDDSQTVSLAKLTCVTGRHLDCRPVTQKCMAH